MLLPMLTLCGAVTVLCSLRAFRLSLRVSFSVSTLGGRITIHKLLQLFCLVFSEDCAVLLTTALSFVRICDQWITSKFHTTSENGKYHFFLGMCETLEQALIVKKKKSLDSQISCFRAQRAEVVLVLIKKAQQVTIAGLNKVICYLRSHFRKSLFPFCPCLLSVTPSFQNQDCSLSVSKDSRTRKKIAKCSSAAHLCLQLKE